MAAEVAVRHGGSRPLTNPEHRLHYETFEGDGPPCLFVHGMLSSGAQWHANLDALSAVVTPVVVELWGHGRSPSPIAPGDYEPRGYLEALDRVRRELGAERIYLCGQSFGATLTLRYALEHPSRVAAQVFTNSVSALASDEWVEEVRANSEERALALERGGHSAILKMPIHPRFAMRLDPHSFRLLNEDAKLLSPAGLAMTVRHTVPAASLRHRLADNTVPTLLVCGRLERAFQPLASWAENHLPFLETVGLEAGHAVNLQSPDEFNRAVIDFFGRHPL